MSLFSQLDLVERLADDGEFNARSAEWTGFKRWWRDLANLAFKATMDGLFIYFQYSFSVSVAQYPCNCISELFQHGIITFEMG